MFFFYNLRNLSPGVAAQQNKTLKVYIMNPTILIIQMGLALFCRAGKVGSGQKRLHISEIIELKP